MHFNGFLFHLQSLETCMVCHCHISLLEGIFLVQTEPQNTTNHSTYNFTMLVFLLNKWPHRDSHGWNSTNGGFIYSFQMKTEVIHRMKTHHKLYLLLIQQSIMSHKKDKYFVHIYLQINRQMTHFCKNIRFHKLLNLLQ